MSVPRVVWLVVAVQTLVLLFAGVLYPTFQQPDEVAHVDYVLAHRHGQWLDGPGQRHMQSGVMAAWAEVPRITAPHLGATLILPRSQRKSFDALGRGSVDPAGLPNQMVQHPPGYYGLATVWSYLLPGFSHHRFDIQVWWLRLLSVLLMVPVPVLIYLAARRLTLSGPIAVTASIIPLAVPTYVRTGASASNDVMMVCFGSVILYLLARVATGDLGKRTAVGVGLAWGILLLSKGFGLVMPPVIVLSYLVGACGTFTQRIRQGWLGAVIAGAVGAALGGWWWIRNEVVYGVLQPDGYGPNWPIARRYGAHPVGTTKQWLLDVYHSMMHRMFGSLGMVDLPTWSYPVLDRAFWFAILLIAIGLWRGYRGSPAPRWAAVTLALPAVFVLMIIVVQSHTAYRITGIAAGLQARYLWGYILGLAVLAAAGLHWLCERIRIGRYATVLAAVLTFAYITSSTLFLLDAEYGTTGGTLRRRIWKGVHYIFGWYPFSPLFSAVLVLALAVSVVVLLVVLVRDAAHRDGEPAAAAPDYATAVS
jgi:hypothetical protein